MGRKTIELPPNYRDLPEDMQIMASEEFYRRQHIFRWGKILKDLEDEGRL